MNIPFDGFRGTEKVACMHPPATHAPPAMPAPLPRMPPVMHVPPATHAPSPPHAVNERAVRVLFTYYRIVYHHCIFETLFETFFGIF